MTADPARSFDATCPVPFWRRLLAALGIGLLATPVGSAAGAFLLGLIGVLHEGWHVLRGVPAFVFYGVIFGPVLAWPVTLVVLPMGRMFFPLRHRRLWLLLTGPLAGALVLTERTVNETGASSLSWVMVAAGAVFRAFVPRVVPSVLEISSCMKFRAESAA